jgi:DNA polymerase (family X)
VFRARNYEKAAKAVAGYPDDLGAVPDAALTKIPGVGSSIAGKIAEYRRSGTIAVLDELRAKIPPGVQEIAKVPGLGPKRALQLSRELGLASVADLEDAVRRGKLHGLSGFGAKSEERILRGIGVITRDAALRDVLRSLPAGNHADDIYAALVPNDAPEDQGRRSQRRGG